MNCISNFDMYLMNFWEVSDTKKTWIQDFKDKTILAGAQLFWL